eukprot:gnl/Dysnectes_brevis/3184_a3976_462.p1 GENE.gnl/Dysnectes_brevis/3184_a3976_462~~gnl/Dysnectes_brevis/3184_a3976_462.p1  ORF type:complete len:667 (-),score=200.57 gnl/Dysnectes_brevis/3184_a3976_462:28-1995(-)
MQQMFQGHPLSVFSSVNTLCICNSELSKARSYLFIEKDTGRCIVDYTPPNLESMTKIRDCLGILGGIHTFSGLSLVLIDSVEHTSIMIPGTIKRTQHPVVRIERVSLLPVSLSPTPTAFRTWERYLTGCLLQHYNSPAFYFALGADITAAQQTGGREQFWWNRHLFFSLNCPRASAFCPRLIHGYVGETELSQGRLVVIARRLTHRAGRRFFRRGIDSDGHCANTVETESVFIRDDGDDTTVMAFIQLRGSAPVPFRQLPDLSTKPPPSTDLAVDQLEATHRHTNWLRGRGRVCFVDLLDDKGFEGAISRQFRGHLKRALRGAGDGEPLTPHAGLLRLSWSMIEYDWFNFHKLCRHLNFDKLRLLTSRLWHLQQFYGTYRQTGSHMDAKQGGVIRTNCLDSLDRTNVVQTFMVLRWTNERCIGAAFEGSTLDDTEDGMAEPHTDSESEDSLAVRRLMARHGDALARQYTGTPAMKSTLRRGGKVGTGMRDGWSWFRRWMANNFSDYRRQDGYDYALGVFEVVPNDGGMEGELPVDGDVPLLTHAMSTRWNGTSCELPARLSVGPLRLPLSLLLVLGPALLLGGLGAWFCLRQFTSEEDVGIVGWIWGWLCAVISLVFFLWISVGILRRWSYLFVSLPRLDPNSKDWLRQLKAKRK